MLKFSAVRLEGETVFVSGSNPEGRDQLQSVTFRLVQDGVVVEGDARLGASGWVGEVPRGGLQPGRVLAFGVGVVLQPDAPVGVGSFTWAVPMELAG